MRKIVFISFIVVILLGSCNKFGSSNGELVGTRDRSDWREPVPHGMVFIPMGSYNMGPSDEDVPFAMTAQNKTVSIDPLWMDETEITNDEYRQFVYWVRDSIARRLLVKAEIESGRYKVEIDPEAIDEQEYNNDDLEKVFLNWDEEIEWETTTPEYLEAIKPLFLPINERFYRRKEVDARKLNYDYFWIDLKQAAKKSNRYNFNADYTDGEYNGEVIDSKGNKVPIENRSSFIMSGRLNIYPDTLVWMADYTYSYNEPLAKNYFWHPAFDDYPVVGVNWKQANAFCIWRTQLKNNYLTQLKDFIIQDYRLPTEAEWEYAARGGLAHSMYPWGGYYTRNNTGCFIANFKPLRGNYGDDGGIRTLPVGKFQPNEYGLFDMAGNIAEWTSNAFDESAYSFTHDLNPDYTYNALAEDHPALKRKVIRGGSWKDIAYYLQTGSRTYEYQDTSKSYIGFRCVRSYLGRNDEDDWKESQFE